MKFDRFARERELKRLVHNPTVASYAESADSTWEHLKLWVVGHDGKTVLHVFYLADAMDAYDLWWSYARYEMPPEHKFERPDYSTLDECEE